MATHKVARVVTTGAIEGWKIESYRGLVSAHVVAGTGFFSDFAASFSDVFGGRSGTYQKQLASLHEEVVAILAERATRLGANWVVGVRMDFDEISGKSKQMFMVSAQGTAVFASESEAPFKTRPDLEGSVTADELESAVARSRLVAQARSGQLDFSEDCWKSLREYQVEEAVIPALRQYVSMHEQFDSEKVWQHCIELIHALATSAAQTQLHKAIEADAALQNVADTLIKQLNLADFDWILRHLNGSEMRLRHAALQLVAADAPLYDRNTLELMDRIALSIEAAFPDRCSTVEKKGLFAKQGAQQWLCACNHRNDLDQPYCAECGYDRRGFRHTDLKPEKAIERLRAQVECLKSILPSDAEQRMAAIAVGNQ